MAPTQEMTEICDLITDSLLPFILARRSILTEETEKDMLLSLSSVNRKIKRWASEPDSEPKKNVVSSLSCGHYCCRQLNQSPEGSPHCLENIVTTLVSFLSIDSRFVQHVSGNIFLSISSFLTSYGSQWIEFIHLLWLSLTEVISSISSSALVSSTFERIVLIDGSLLQFCLPNIVDLFGREDPGCDFARFIALLQSRVENENWLLVTSIFQILRNILKSLKREDSYLERVFVNLAVPCLTKMPWGLFSEINVTQSLLNHMRSDKYDQLNRNESSNGIKGVLLGSILQLSCSLVEQNDPEDPAGAPLNDLAVFSEFANLLTQLLYCCFPKQLGHKDKCISQYLMHKLLALINRLSSYSGWKHFYPALWLKLLKYYFGDLLYKSISDIDTGSQNCLEGSPFLAKIDDTLDCTLHLHRQAIFLLLKCCLTSVHRKATGQGCACAAEAPSLTAGLPLCSSNCCYIGLLELSEWLQRCGFLHKLKKGENYSKSCSSFALSFLQLYMDEDDMLFEMLLLLQDVPFSLLQTWKNANDRSLEKLEGDVLFHISNIFNPVHLFHLFLLLLHYDHLVLVDYLISKDTGVHCVKYLLSEMCFLSSPNRFMRSLFWSLRLICQSWSVFVEFSASGSETNQLCHKRRKISVKEDCEGFFVSQTSDSNFKNINLCSFENAKQCLLSLKRSVADLHQKSLFPYNPRPLLRRRNSELERHVVKPRRSHKLAD